MRTARRKGRDRAAQDCTHKVGAGETAVWVHTEAERFVARRTRYRGAGRQTLAITDGLHDGDRVVTDGRGPLLAQVRTRTPCSTPSFTPASPAADRAGPGAAADHHGAVTLRQMPVDVFPRPQQTDRDADDRSRRHGAGRGRTTGELPIESGMNGMAGRDAALRSVSGHRACRWCTSSSNGVPTSTATGSRSPNAWNLVREQVAARGIVPADGADPRRSWARSC